MKNLSKLWAVMLVLLLVFVLPTIVFGDNDKGNKGQKEATQVHSSDEENVSTDEDQAENSDEDVDEDADTDEDAEVDEDQSDEGTGEENGKGKGLDKDWKISKDALQQEKADIAALKDQVEVQLEDLEQQYQLAEANGDTALMETLMSQMQQLHQEKDTYQEQMKQKIQEMQDLMKERYSQEELDALTKVAEELGQDEKVKVLPVTNVFMKNGEVKFDTPPVVKEGRILLPLRAISEATGATVAWDPGAKKVTITQGEKEIIFDLTLQKVYVDGTETTIDVSADVMNNRTVVPLRFIMENLGLKVQWEPETKVIEIE
ncbi:copper amine oxidase N-terminal domain-containing protein [Candidatus Formimonas warabiya]|uniref:Copper amine oxidase-like N-terminal domain-containing protein n=1 Tax=Formimonas warabiya TaxID=1761012 RepID=A0A3G1KVS9_FORW1|nr:copper amine oxidase N-terminal domain-containing protein [Candidatus Formimonas warabiya]ATW26598.1 hypothetical protein DCMF_19220 [Candidatus Formimonas warabiya]